MRLNGGVGRSATSKGTGGHSRNNAHRFEVSDDLINVADESMDEVHMGRGVNDLRNGRAVTPVSSYSVATSRTGHSVLSADHASRASSSLSRSSMRKRETFRSQEDIHPYGLVTSAVVSPQSSRASPSPGRNVTIVDKSVFRRETVSSVIVGNGHHHEQNSTSAHVKNLDERVHRSGHISSHLNNNKANTKTVQYRNTVHDSLISEESDTSRLAEGVSTTSFISAPVTHTLSAVWYYLSKVVTRVGNFIYLFLVGTFLFEKWCLYVKRQPTESTEGEDQSQYFRHRSNYQSSNVKNSVGTFEISECESDQSASRLSVSHNPSFRDRFGSVRNRFNQFFTQRNADQDFVPIVEEDNANYVSDDEDAVIVNSFQYRASENNEATSHTRSSFLSASQLYGNGLMESLLDGLIQSWSLIKILLRLFVILLVLFLIWTYGSDVVTWSQWTAARDGIWSALSFIPNGGIYVFSSLLNSVGRSSDSSPAQNIITTQYASSVNIERPKVNPDHTTTGTAKTSDSMVTMSALRLTKESLDALKLQISVMEETLKEHGEKLKTHDDTFIKLNTEISKIYEAMKTASAKEKPLEQIIDEVLAAKIGEDAKGQPVTLKTFFAFLKVERERIVQELDKHHQMFLTRMDQISKLREDDNGEIRASLKEVDDFVNELKVRFDEGETGKDEGQNIEGKLLALKLEMLGKVSEVEKLAKADKSEMLKIVETLRDKTVEQLTVKSSPTVEPQMDIEKLQELLLPILISKVQMNPSKPCSTNTCVGDFSVADIELMIKRAISKYDADKTGLPDLALESAGGSVINTRCTKSSELRNSVISYWGFRLWSPPNTPRTIIQPGVVPGECWAFEGSVGDVVIKLAVPAIVTGFTLEHIPKSVSRYQNIDSAPKHFQVLGLLSEHDTTDVHDFGSFTYEDNDEPLQYFPVVNATTQYYPIVELKILSNHGNIRHTCIYRFRVHGAIDLTTRPQNGGLISKPKSNSPINSEAAKASVSSNKSN